MTKLTTKMLAYVGARVEGLKKREAAIAAGYAHVGADVTAAKLEKDPRIKTAIATAKQRAKRAAAEPDDDDEEKKPKSRLKASYPSSLELLRGVYNNDKMPDSTRIDAAKAALPFEHGRIVDTGKKQKKVEAAKDIAAGKGARGGKPKFATKSPPPLRSIQGGKAS